MNYCICVRNDLTELNFTPRAQVDVWALEEIIMLSNDNRNVSLGTIGEVLHLLQLLSKSPVILLWVNNTHTHTCLSAEKPILTTFSYSRICLDVREQKNHRVK